MYQRWNAYDKAVPKVYHFILKAELYLGLFNVLNKDITHQDMVRIFDTAIHFAKLVAFD